MHQPGILPFHPTARHPHTGAPIRALYVRSDGRIMWPILGASPDDGAGSGAGGDGGGAGSGDGSGGDGSGAGGDGKGAGGDSGSNGSGSGDGGKESDLGFPKDTPVAEMTVAQQAAYYKHQSQKHEGRNKELLKITGGKHGDELKKDFEELETLRKSKMTDGEKAVAEAEAKGRREASLALVPKLFDVALAHVEEDRRKTLIGTIDKTTVLNADGTIDTDKVTDIAKALAPSDKGTGSGTNYGQGRRGSGGTGRPGSVAEVIAARQAARADRAAAKQ